MSEGVLHSPTQAGLSCPCTYCGVGGGGGFRGVCEVAVRGGGVRVDGGGEVVVVYVKRQ